MVLKLKFATTSVFFWFFFNVYAIKSINEYVCNFRGNQMPQLKLKSRGFVLNGLRQAHFCPIYETVNRLQCLFKVRNNNNKNYVLYYFFLLISILKFSNYRSVGHSCNKIVIEDLTQTFFGSSSKVIWFDQAKNELSCSICLVTPNQLLRRRMLTSQVQGLRPTTSIPGRGIARNSVLGIETPPPHLSPNPFCKDFKLRGA